MNISSAMERAKKNVMMIVDDDTGEFIFHGKERLAEKITIETLIGFFQDPGVLLAIEKAKRGENADTS